MIGILNADLISKRPKNQILFGYEVKVDQILEVSSVNSLRSSDFSSSSSEKTIENSEKLLLAN